VRVHAGLTAWDDSLGVVSSGFRSALRASGIRCERWLKSPFPPSKTRGKGLSLFIRRSCPNNHGDSTSARSVLASATGRMV
jgi:hypothetical protein